MIMTILVSSNTQMPHAVLNLCFVPEYMCPAVLTLFPLSSELFLRLLRISASELSAVLKQDRDGFCTRLLVACYGRQMRLLWFLMSTCSVGSPVSKPLSCVCLIWGAGIFDGENLHIYWVVENVSARACYIHLSVVSHVSGREEQSCRVTQSFSVKIGRMNPCSLHTRAGSR